MRHEQLTRAQGQALRQYVGRAYKRLDRLYRRMMAVGFAEEDEMFRRTRVARGNLESLMEAVDEVANRSIHYRPPAEPRWVQRMRER